MKKRLLSILIAALMIVAVIPMTAVSSFAAVGGQCSNPNLTWSYDSSLKKLTISGNGPMYNDKTVGHDIWMNTELQGSSPWDSYEITTVEIKSGVTSISDYAFYNNDVRNYYIPLTVKTIGNLICENFYRCGVGHEIDINVYYEGSEEDWDNITHLADSSLIVFEYAGSLAQVATVYFNYSLSIIELTRTLSVGCKGDDVKAVQQKLYDLGYLTVKPDGIYGAKSKDAVIAFQAFNGLESPDGKVGNWTLNALNYNPVAFKVLKKGISLSSGEKNAVKNFQKRLVSLGYLRATPDGSYGNLTYQAVVKFQKANGIYADGTIGRITAAKLYSNPVKYSIKLSRTLSYGDSGAEVKEVQEALVAYGFLNVTPDGKYGAMTEAAVKLFQAYNGLTSPDGKVGNWTLKQLNGKPYTFRTITTGYKGTSVKVMQTYLKKLGYLNATPDGKYGAYTEKAVLKFQAINGLSTSNGVDLNTMLRLFSRNGIGILNINYDKLLTIQNYYKTGLSYMNRSLDRIKSGLSTTALANIALANGQFKAAKDACGNSTEFSVLKSYFSKVDSILYNSLSRYDTGSAASDIAIVNAVSDCLPYIRLINEIFDLYIK